jgi:[CysO sulfur-carrier protein]-S-L-cysteine hydrolase
VQNAIYIARDCVKAMEAHARENSEEECCGLLAGRSGAITRAIAARNVAENPATNYEIAPVEIIRKLREIRRAGLELLGIYHSHPRSENLPSPKDVELAAYPDAAYCILSPLVPPEKSVRAFLIRDGLVTELAIEIV